MKIALDEFIRGVEEGKFTDANGSGVYSTANVEGAIPARPSDVKRQIVPGGWPYVDWNPR